MTPGRRLFAISASAVIHAGLVGLAILAASAGASAILLVDLVEEMAGDGRDRGAPAPGPDAPRERPASSKPRDGRPRSGAPSPAADRPNAPSGRAEPALPSPAAAAETPAETRPPPAIEPPKEAAALPRLEPPPRAEAAGRADRGVPALLAAQVRDASGDRARSDRAAVAGDEDGSRDGARAPSQDAARARDSGAGAGAAPGGPPGSSDPALARIGDGDGRGGTPPEYGPYLQRFRKRVEAGLTYPLAARRRGLSGDVELEVLLDPSGRVGSARVVASSSHAVLDEAALEAVKDVAPEPLPAGLPQRAIRVRLPLGFRLE